MLAVHGSFMLVGIEESRDVRGFKQALINTEFLMVLYGIRRNRYCATLADVASQSCLIAKEPLTALECNDSD